MAVPSTLFSAPSVPIFTVPDGIRNGWRSQVFCPGIACESNHDRSTLTTAKESMREHKNFVTRL